MQNNIININAIDIRSFSESKHKQVDDTPYGGGSGMVMSPTPIFSAYSHAKNICTQKTRVVFMTPHGKPFNQNKAIELSKEKDLIILCGHYEGIDQRVIDTIVTDEISLGDYILTGGELASIVLIDSVSRLISGVLSKESSHMEESFSDGLLEYPHYTKPRVFMGKEVPAVLLSGHHKNIDLWRKEQSAITTLKKRPDLISSKNLTKAQLDYISTLKKNKSY
jgi:tRNA (guanine37-N1)-methyltransferase